MKRYLFVSIIAIGCAFGLSALCYGEKKNTALKQLIIGEKLYKDGDLLAAMDTVSDVLRDHPNNQAAKDYIHEHWDATVRQMHQDLLRYRGKSNLHDADTCVYIYGTMIHIYDNLRSGQLPLRGRNDEWVWIPELEYLDGDYSDALILQKKMQAIEADKQKRLEAISGQHPSSSESSEDDEEDAE